MSIVTSSKLPRRKRTKSKVATLPDVLLLDDSPGELADPSVVVAEVEARLTNRVKESKQDGIVDSKFYAKNMHEEADKLYFKGEYESALVLYHKAARLNPGNPNHLVGAQRASRAITASVNPDKSLGRLMRESRNPAQRTTLVCPEAAARRARAIVAQSSDPTQDIPKILQYFDSRKDFWRLSPRKSQPELTRSRSMQRQLNKCVKSTVQELTSAYDSGDSQAITQLSDELVNLVALTDEPNRNRIETYAFLATRQIIAGRHDKAVDYAAKMFFLARTTNDPASMVKALVILGRVHMNFGHIDALARVWERLSDEIKTERIPHAWLCHDIGRCHLELGNYERALTAANLCLARAEPIGCKKWIIRGKLLSGLALAKLIRYDESLVVLRSAMNHTLDDEAEKPMFDYIMEVLEHVAKLARESNKLENRIERTRLELEAIMAEGQIETEEVDEEEEEIVETEKGKDEKWAKGLLNVFQTLEKHLDTVGTEEEQHQLEEKKEPGQLPHKEGELDTVTGFEEETLKEEKQHHLREDKIAILLERTRAMRRPGEESRSMIPRPTHKSVPEEPIPKLPDSSRTHVICKDSDSKSTLCSNDDVSAHSDISEPHQDDGPDKTSEFNQDAASERNLSDEEAIVQEATKDVFDMTNFSYALDDDQNSPLPELSEYLKSLENDEFFRTESSYLDE